MKKSSGKDNRKVYHTLTNFDKLNHVSGADMTLKKRITAITVDEARLEIINQMEMEGLRERTVKEYIK